MTEKLHDILERIYNQGCYAGESSHIDDWLYEEGCDRADYITTMIREALGEQTAVKDSLNPAGNDAESRFVDKACEWLDKRLEFYAVDAGCFNYERFFKDFRKAMTEKTSPLFEQCLANVNPETRAEVRQNMDAVVKDSLTTELTWHKASEELPYRNGIYLIRGVYENLTKDIFYSTSAYDAEYGKFINYPSYGIVTHWMEIPEIKED